MKTPLIHVAKGARCLRDLAKDMMLCARGQHDYRPQVLTLPVGEKIVASFCHRRGCGLPKPSAPPADLSS